MRRENLWSRFLIPLFLPLSVMIFFRIVYFNSVRIDNPSMYHAVAVVSGVLQFASVVLPALLVYPVTYFRGAKAVERVIACSANLAVWVGIDSYQVSGAFPLPESIYCGVNIGSILFAWNFALMGILELVCRSVSRKRGEPVRVLTPLPFIPVVVFVFVICLLSKQAGAYYFNLLLDGYLALFRS